MSNSEQGIEVVGTAHSSHCFVVMPFGKNSGERKWFSGWYEVVLKPAIEECGYTAILAAAEDQPGAINDEIRAHLALDPMVVVDLGGHSPDDQPNPNVMYELGIRHAFGLPVVVMAWEEQKLPFDVGNQRAIMCQRGFKDIADVKAKLIRFIKAAEDGNFYRPMEAVGREAALDNVSMSLGEESAVGALISEVRYLRQSLLTSQLVRSRNRYRSLTAKKALGRVLKGELWQHAQNLGWDSVSWSKFLSIKLDEELYSEATDWTLDDWKRFLVSDGPMSILRQPKAQSTELPEKFIDVVDDLLCEQPWPKGEARRAAEKLDVSVSTVSKAIKILMDTGRRKYQHKGQLFENNEDYLLAVEQDPVAEQ